MSFNLLVGILSVSWFVIELFLQSLLIRNTDRSMNRKDSRLLLYLSWLTIFGGSFLGIAMIKGSVPIISSSSQVFPVTGISLIVIGAAIRWAAVFTLKKYFTVNLKIADGQKIKKTGLYRLVRHPSYSGLLLSILGLAVNFANLVSFVLIFPLFTVWIIKRIRIEEEMMLDAFGSEYVDYMKKSKKLVPFVY